jgi:hypothetical protein
MISPLRLHLQLVQRNTANQDMYVSMYVLVRIAHTLRRVRSCTDLVLRIVRFGSVPLCSSNNTIIERDGICATIAALLLGKDGNNSCEQKDKKNFHIKWQLKLSNVNGNF